MASSFGSNPSLRNRSYILPILAFACWGPFLSAAEVTTPRQQADRIYAETGITGGVVVHSGCGDGQLTAALQVGEKYLVQGLEATGHDSRVDLRWTPNSNATWIGFNVYRSTQLAGPFEKLNNRPHHTHVFSDFVGENGKTYFYRVCGVARGDRESVPAEVVSAQTRPMSDDELLTSVQQATFRYFWDYGHPVSGLPRERLGSRDTCTAGAGTGFAVMALMVGSEREFAPRDDIARRVLTIIRFLEDKASRYHGAWSHWINGRTGQTIPFASKNGVKADDGGDLVETAFLMQGLLAARQYFDRDNAVEAEIRTRVTRLWQAVEWDWYLRVPGGKTLYWHWSPKYNWLMDHKIGGHFNECMITYLLAIASPTHSIPPDCYYEGWVGDAKQYANGKSYYGIVQPVGWPRGGPLFFTHYSFIGFDPRHKRDRFCDYFENNRAISLINRAYCSENPKHYVGYSELAWGLTASDTPGGYKAHAPGQADNGTLSPTAAIGAMPYTPVESLAALKHFYHQYGAHLWGEFGFRDAMNPSQQWYADSYLAIDQGPIICMIENYRSALCWRMFMANPEIMPALKAIGWEIE